MSDGNGEHKDQQQPPGGTPEPVKKSTEDLPKAEVSEKQPDTVIQIVLKAEGGFQVGAPGHGGLFDEPICFWMLDKAKDYIKASNARKRQAGIVLPGSTLRRPM
jgi:hypothetical protein